MTSNPRDTLLLLEAIDAYDNSLGKSGRAPYNIDKSGCTLLVRPHNIDSFLASLRSRVSVSFPPASVVLDISDGAWSDMQVYGTIHARGVCNYFSQYLANQVVSCITIDPEGHGSALLARVDADANYKSCFRALLTLLIEVRDGTHSEEMLRRVDEFKAKVFFKSGMSTASCMVSGHEMARMITCLPAYLTSSPNYHVHMLLEAMPSSMKGKGSLHSEYRRRLVDAELMSGAPPFTPSELLRLIAHHIVEFPPHREVQLATKPKVRTRPSNPVDDERRGKRKCYNCARADCDGAENIRKCKRKCGKCKEPLCDGTRARRCDLGEGTPFPTRHINGRDLPFPPQHIRRRELAWANNNPSSPQAKAVLAAEKKRKTDRSAAAAEEADTEDLSDYVSEDEVEYVESGDDEYEGHVAEAPSHAGSLGCFVTEETSDAPDDDDDGVFFSAGGPLTSPTFSSPTSSPAPATPDPAPAPVGAGYCSRTPSPPLLRLPPRPASAIREGLSYRALRARSSPLFSMLREPVSRCSLADGATSAPAPSAEQPECIGCVPPSRPVRCLSHILSDLRRLTSV